MQAYLDLLREALEQGAPKGDRTGTGVRSLFGRQLRFDLRAGFPLVTTKRLHIKSIVHELIWFLNGDTNVRYLQDNGVCDLGRMGGRQRRSRTGLRPSNGAPGKARTGASTIRSPGCSPRSSAIPNSRRLIVSAWNVPDVERMKLPPCHCLFQFYVADGRLSCQLYQRSADLFLGVPFNIASYALLTHLIARECDLDVGDFVHTFGDAHLYIEPRDPGARAAFARAAAAAETETRAGAAVAERGSVRSEGRGHRLRGL